jgi:hypothetical protein
MKRLVVCAAALLFSSAAMAQAPATQRGSGQTPGGPARENISETGGKKKATSRPMRVRSGQDPGGPAGGAISETGGRKKAVRTPRPTRSGQTPGGPRPQ